MPADLSAAYRLYVDCLNRRDWAALPAFVHERVSHNGRPLGLAGYRAMLERDCDDIPDLAFTIGLLVREGDTVAARLLFDCTPKGEFLGLAVDGRRVCFAENVFYRFEDGRIRTVWSVIDGDAIAAQLR